MVLDQLHVLGTDFDINTSPDNVPLCFRPHLIHHLVELVLFLVPGLVFWVPSPKQNTKKRKY